MQHRTGTASGHGLVVFTRGGRPAEPGAGELLALTQPRTREQLEGGLDAVRAAAAERMAAGDEVEVRLMRRRGRPEVPAAA